MHTCLAFQWVDNNMAPLIIYEVSHLTYQQTFQVYGRPGIAYHVLQLLQPGLQPPLGAQRHVYRGPAFRVGSNTNSLLFTCDTLFFWLMAVGLAQQPWALCSPPKSFPTGIASVHNEQKIFPKRLPLFRKTSQLSRPRVSLLAAWLLAN